MHHMIKFKICVNFLLLDRYLGFVWSGWPFSCSKILTTSSSLNLIFTGRYNRRKSWVLFLMTNFHRILTYVSGHINIQGLTRKCRYNTFLLENRYFVLVLNYGCCMSWHKGNTFNLLFFQLVGDKFYRQRRYFHWIFLFVNTMFRVLFVSLVAFVQSNFLLLRLFQFFCKA